ncbi:6,7-dimethyl-8-ribityllumazine synthase [bacterium]|mgnify:CR=1 FL=1|nr:MAG: 6,7-dimethyl-8-ribityllumazine synthase [bacterium]
MKEYKGEFSGQGIQLAVVVSRFNEFISTKLLDGTLDYLNRHGVDTEQVSIFWVPGSFEIPLVAKKLAESNRFDGVICLGAVIRGDTPHFTYIAAEVTKGIAQTALQTGIPVAYGILTTDTVEQAIERAGTKSGNKGWFAAESVLEMISLLKQI